MTISLHALLGLAGATDTVAVAVAAAAAGAQLSGAQTNSTIWPLIYLCAGLSCALLLAH